ncbi:hypothetical protein ES703_54692 [subsurface metagenome]
MGLLYGFRGYVLGVFSDCNMKYAYKFTKNFGLWVDIRGRYAKVIFIPTLNITILYVRMGFDVRTVAAGKRTVWVSVTFTSTGANIETHYALAFYNLESRD